MYVHRIDRDTVVCISLAARPGNHGNRFHNYLYAELGLNYLYKSFSSSDIGDTVRGIRSLGIRGAGVSMPYKESCMPFLDHVHPSAAAIDSVNTIVNDDGVLTGYNTDYLAVLEMLRLAPLAPGTDFAVLGAGGMAKAAVAALVDAGFTEGVVVARSAERGRSLARRYGVTSVPELGPRRPRLLLNATPIGMAGGAESEHLAFGADVVDAADAVFDVVALPAQTPLVRRAGAAGKIVLTGAEVMQRQAAEQFVLYTGVRPTPEQLERAESYAADPTAATGRGGRETTS